MDEEYKPMISDEERAARRAQRAESRRKKRRARRMRQLRRLVPCGLLAVLCVGLVTVGAQLIEKPRPEVGKAGQNTKNSKKITLLQKSAYNPILKQKP